MPILIAQAGLADACGPDPGFLCELVYDQTGSETLAELAEVLVVPLKIVVILLLAWLLNRVARRAIARATEHLVAQTESLAAAGPHLGDQAPVRASLQRRALDRARRMAEMSARAQQRARTLGAVLRSVTAIVIFTIAALMMLGEVDINLGPLIAGAGIAGIAIGFGAQSLVKDFLSGIFMLIEDQYGVGDIVDVGEAAGVVEQVNLRTTQLRDVNGTLWHVPNGEIRRVGNKSQDWARTVLDVEVSYDTDIDHATSVIKRVADSVWEDDLPDATVLEEPEIWGVEMFGENAIVIRLAMKTEPAEQFTVARMVRRRLKEAFDREGIEIPFPQRTIWLRGQPGPIEVFAPPAEGLGAEEAAVEAAAEPGKEAASGPEEAGD